MAEGLAECQHPYVFIASRGFKELLEAKVAVCVSGARVGVVITNAVCLLLQRRVGLA